MRELMAKGRLRRRNPRPHPLSPSPAKPERGNARGTAALGRLAPPERRLLDKARRMARQFHGRSEVVELAKAERKPLPRFVVEVGELDDLSYAPPAGSKRAAHVYRHVSGDRGASAPPSPNRPLLVVDPRNARPAMVMNRSPMKLRATKGLVG